MNQFVIYIFIMVCALGYWQYVNVRDLRKWIARVDARLNKLDPDSRAEFIDHMMTAMDTSVSKHVYHAVKEQFGGTA